MRRIFLLLMIGLAACGDASERTAGTPPPSGAEASSGPNEGVASAEPSETALAPEPTDERGAEAAVSVARAYFDLVETGRYGAAWRLWSDDGRASGMDERSFAAGFGRYRDYRAELGAPGRIEGAAGTLYVDIPVRIRGHLTGGQPVEESGSVTLRRANEVPGATEEQRQWRIAAIRLDPQSVP